MESLAKSLNEARTDVAPGAFDDILRDAATKWAEHCLKFYVGERLRKGFEISMAISNFLDSIENER
jgi:hypothetical protein